MAKDYNGDWREKDEKFQKKTAGGVYFWGSSNSLWGKDIDEKLYEKLPAYIKKAVVHLDNNKTPDGNHAFIHYVNRDGQLEFYDDYGLADFFYALKHSGRDAYGDMNDYEYDGQWSEGVQLSKKSSSDKGEPDKWITINGKHIPVYND